MRSESDGLVGIEVSSLRFIMLGTLPLDPGARRRNFFSFYVLAMIAGVWYVPPFTRSAQIVRAILLASATATTL